MPFRRRIWLPALLHPPEAVTDVAVVAAVPARCAAVHYEFLPAVHASQMPLSLRALPDRLRVGSPPRPAACVGAESAATPAPGLDDLPAVAGAYILGREGLTGSHPVEIMRGTEIAHRIPADSQLGGDGSISDAALPERPDAFLLIRSNRHESLLPREVALTEMSVGGHGVVVHILKMELFNDSARGQVVLRLDEISQHIVAELAGSECVHRNGDRLRNADGIGDLYFAAMCVVCGNDVAGNLPRHIRAGAVNLGGVFAGESAAAMTAYAPVAVRDDFLPVTLVSAKEPPTTKEPVGLTSILKSRFRP